MPVTGHPTESARINLRTSPEAKALIERAAAIMGSTVSSFMLQNAYEAASRLIASGPLPGTPSQPVTSVAGMRVRGRLRFS